MKTSCSRSLPNLKAFYTVLWATFSQVLRDSMKSYSKPTNKQLDQAMPLLSSPQHEAYFFSRLENPNWIGPLAERDVFKYPPKAEHLEGEVRFPAWPPGRYLARMAAK